MKIGIRDATLNDTETLFNWANDVETRKNSFTTAAVDWAQHVLWFNKKLIDNTSKIYILLFDEKPIAVVRFEIKDTTIIGITVSPEYRGLGLGSKCLILACSKFWENNNTDILAYIKIENIASQRIFKKAGFQFLKEDFFNGLKCIILKAENGKQLS